MQYLLDTIWYHTDRHEHWKSVTYPRFCSEPRTGASSKNVLPPTSAFIKVYNGQAFPSEETAFFLFFLTETVPGTPRQAYTLFFLRQYSNI